MAFSSVPVYLDPPNWQQQANQHQHENPLQLSPAMPPPPGAGGGGIGSIRPGSMTDRARLAKITTQPESALKCPRCESTNTKFCYFNNYSLSQPRHFCKTCRRYWTRGGALRNVPVGGGCRRNNNKRTKRARSKSPVKGDEIRRNGTSNDVVISNLLPPPTHNTNNLPFLSTTTTTPNLHNFSEFTCTQNGLNHQMEVQSFSSTARFTDQLRFQQMQQQFPFFAALEQQPSTNLYQYEDQAAAEYDSNIGTKALELSGNVKVEENKSVSQGNNMMMNLPRNNLGFANNHQFNWTDHITGYASTSTSQLL